MSELMEYDPTLVPKGFGITNRGNTCYFNSLFQCILSCPAIYKTLKAIENEEYVQKHNIAKNLIKMWEAAMKGDSEAVQRYSGVIWTDIILLARSKKDRVLMDSGNQQDVHEGLMIFLDSMSIIPEFSRLFQHRYCTKILCEKCKEYVVQVAEINLVFEVQSDLKTEQIERFKAIDASYQSELTLNEFLKSQNGYADKDFKCPKEKIVKNEDGTETTVKCGLIGEKFRQTTLTMIPEIIAIVIKKYRSKTKTPFPLKLEFPTKDNTAKFVYELVAQSEHAGSMNGGHYWAVCKRSNGWCMLNDSSVSQGTPGPTENSYLIFYNYIGKEPM